VPQYRVSEAAELLGVSSDTVRRWTDSGRLAVIKGAGVVMFFMHLRGDARVYQLLFIAPLTLASSMILVFLAIFSNYVGIGG